MTPITAKKVDLTEIGLSGIVGKFTQDISDSVEVDEKVKNVSSPQKV